jgi:excisionase family DNA binding protein
MNFSETSVAGSLASPPEDRLWTTKQAADFLLVSTRTVFNLRKVGLPYVQLGGTVRFNAQALKDYLAAHPHLSFHRLRQLARHRVKSS